MLVATAGHVDHGKTSLVHHITGTDTDRLREEKDRGLSINLGFAYHHFAGGTIGFVDVPGHIDFIKNMLAGVAAVDFALVVVAADDGIMPQTREHLAILDLLGIGRGAVALTKIDRVNAGRVAEVSTQIRALLQSTALAEAPVFPVSNASGEGISGLVEHLQQVAAGQVGNKNGDLTEYCRYSIDRAFTVKGIGTVITGTLIAGELAIGDTLMHSGTGSAVRIRGLRVDQQDVERAGSGQRLAVNINVAHQHVHRGDWLLAKPLLHSVSQFDALLTPLPGERNWLQQRPRKDHWLHLHCGAAHCLARARLLPYSIPTELNNTEKMWVRVTTKQPLYCLHGDRFIIRDADASHTLAGGEVMDIFVPARTQDAHQQFLNSLYRARENALKELLANQPLGVNLSQFSVMRNWPQENLQHYLQPLVISDSVLVAFLTTDRINDPPAGVVILQCGGQFSWCAMDAFFFATCGKAVLNQIQHHHRQAPDQQGVDELTLYRSGEFKGRFALFRGIVQKLIDLALLRRSGTLLHQPGHEARLSDADLEFYRQLQPLVSTGELVAPRTRELMAALDVDINTLDAHLQRLCSAGLLVQVSRNRYYLPADITKIAAVAEKLAASSEDACFTVIEFRDASGIGRNHCIELLEYFDRLGFTLRRGNQRLIRVPREHIFC